MIFDQWTEERSIEVSGKGGWVAFTGQQIKGDYSITVVADSVVPLSQAQKQASAIQALDAFRGDPRIDQARLYEYVLAQLQAMGIPTDLILSEEEFQQNQNQQMVQQLILNAKGGAQPKKKEVNSNGNRKTRA